MFKHNEKYAATLVDAGLTESKSGNPTVFLTLEVTDDAGGKQRLIWNGHLTEKAQEQTIKTLIGAGFSGDDVADLNKGLIMFAPKPLTVVMEEHTYEGKTTMRIKYVNGGGTLKAFKGQAPKMAALFSKVRAEMGVKKPAAAPAVNSSEEVPF